MEIRRSRSKGRGYLLGLGLRRAISYEDVQMVDLRQAPVVSGRQRWHDEMQGDEAGSGAWSGSSIAS
jgi:hypothetical protein